ncbi:MAG: hypothetical protein ACYTFO_00660 [Planctomycetota bacterium]
MIPLILIVAGGILAGLAIVSIGPHIWRRADIGGDAGEGLVIFVESIRWLGVPWGMKTAAAGLRRAGFAGEFRYWRHHSAWRGWLVLPVVAAPKMLERESQRLADFITAQRREAPDRPIYVVGYSAGGYVAVRALELLPDNVSVEGTAMLAPAFSPWRDLSSAARRVSPGRFIVCSSSLDWLIVGLGTFVFGTCDRKHALSAGMIGHRGPGAIREVRWRPCMIASGHLGDHFSASATGFVTRYVAPVLFGDEREST